MTYLSRFGVAVSLLLTAIGLTSCNSASTPPAQPAAAVDTRAADEAAIRAADVAWVKAAASKDPGQASSFYADNAVLMVAGEKIVTGKDTIQKSFAGLMTDPKFALTFSPSKVEVSKSGDLAYEIGDYAITFTDPKAKGKTLTTKAMYVVVWGKQADGSWKALVDAPGTTTN